MRKSRNTEVTAYSFNMFIIFTIHLSFIFHPSHGFEVMQPQNRTVNPDGVVSISCEHNARVNSVVDVRLSRISLIDNKKTLLCQKGKDDCKNILMHSEDPAKWLFILLNIGPEAMNMMYQCEFTVNEDDLHVTATGEPTRLLQGQKETEKDCAPPSPLPPPSPSDQLRWILIGLLALMFVCMCVIACFYFRERKKEPENCTYVVMRKAPLLRNPVDSYCGSSPLPSC